MWNARQYRSRGPMSLGLVVMATMVVFASIGCDREEFDPEAAESDDGPVDRSDQYTTEIDGATVVVDENNQVKLQVFPGPDLNINDEFPWMIEFDDVEGLEFEQSDLRWDDMELTDDKATIPISVTAEDIGEYTVEAKADLSVCNEDRCDILRDEPLEVGLEAQK